MFQRKRLTGIPSKFAAEPQEKEASPAPALPGYDQAGKEHPASQPDPDAHKYENGDTSSWAEDPTEGPYPNSTAPALPGYDEAGKEHPAAKKAATAEEEQARLAWVQQKAAKACRLVEGLTVPDADVKDMEKKAELLMDIPEAHLDNTWSTLSKLGFFSAEEEPAAKEAAEEPAAKEAAEEPAAKEAMHDDKDDKDDDKDDKKASEESAAKEAAVEEDLDTKIANGVAKAFQAMLGATAKTSDDPAVKAMYAALTAGKKSDCPEDDMDEGYEDMEEIASKKKAAVEVKFSELRAVMASEVTDDQVRSAAVAIVDKDFVASKKNAAVDAKFAELRPVMAKEVTDDQVRNAAVAIVEKEAADKPAEVPAAKEAAERVVAMSADGLPEGIPEKVADDKAAGFPDFIQDKIDAKKDGDKDKDKDDDKDDDKKASLEEADIVLANGTDPLALVAGDDSAEVAEISRLLFGGDEKAAMNYSDDDDDDDKDDEAMAGKKAAEDDPAPRPQPKKAGVGPSTLGNLSRTASTKNDEIANLSSLWPTSPDISDRLS